MTIQLSKVIRHDAVRPLEVRFDGFAAPTEIEITVTGEADADIDVTIRAVIGPDSDYRYAPFEVIARQRDGGPPVSNLTLRALHIQRYMRVGLESLFDVSPLEVPADEAERIRLLGPSSGEALAAVSRVYSFANAVNMPPAKAVQQVFKMSAPTASAWIRRARDLTFIPTSQPLPRPFEDVASDG